MPGNCDLIFTTAIVSGKACVEALPTFLLNPGFLRVAELCSLLLKGQSRPQKLCELSFLTAAYWFCRAVLAIAAKATAAVSIRRIEPGHEMRWHFIWSANSTSSSENPPSGPISNVWLSNVDVWSCSGAFSGGDGWAST